MLSNEYTGTLTMHNKWDKLPMDLLEVYFTNGNYDKLHEVHT